MSDITKGVARSHERRGEGGGGRCRSGGGSRASGRWRRPGAARSTAADGEPGDEAEVKAVKLTLLLNLATTWTKIDNMDQVLKCANDALAIDPKAPKALFRRAMVLEKRKKFDEAKKDLELALQQPGAAEDKAIATLMKRVDIQIKREKDKEKKMASKMFG